ncbi:Retinol dehydrogenase 8 [Trichoplax sp. H2]|nr:Retinol dehydrogenase 8 [Trichoplax sp. H2]|eukprot:RDD39932.1 Retinol dehydrogenase 8 [Trichoplax sp. H2]
MVKVVLITGCSTGIGLALAARLANSPGAEYKVYATMRDVGKQGPLVQAAENSINKTLLIRKLDVCQANQVEEIMKEILDTEGKIDILVNNAAFGLVCAFEKMPMEIAQNMMDTNFFGCMRSMQACIPVMKKQGYGQIINVSSCSGIFGVPFLGLYSASKFALEGLSESLAPELNAFGINISLIEPGPVNTPFIDTWVNIRQNLNEQVDQRTGQMVDTVAQTIINRPMDARQSADGVVDVIMKCIRDEKPLLRYPTAESVTNLNKRKLVDPTGQTVLDVTRGFYPIFDQ